MCDYCRCRANDAIANLSVEHEELLGMLTDLQRHADTLDAAAAKPLLERLHHALTPHALREEHGVFAELEHAGIDQTYIDMFQQDHDAIHSLLAGTDATDREPAAREHALARTLRDHIAREESDLFPAAHQLLVPGQWDAVDRSHRPFAITKYLNASETRRAMGGGSKRRRCCHLRFLNTSATIRPRVRV